MYLALCSSGSELKTATAIVSLSASQVHANNYVDYDKTVTLCVFTGNKNILFYSTLFYSYLIFTQQIQKTTP